ncbi:hypothetical protein N7540_012209 [Penicillium herquei]|nr:hypothetical protein N7540_012209 [Penicillium herquei]
MALKTMAQPDGTHGVRQEPYDLQCARVRVYGHEHETATDGQLVRLGGRYFGVGVGSGGASIFVFILLFDDILILLLDDIFFLLDDIFLLLFHNIRFLGRHGSLFRYEGSQSGHRLVVGGDESQPHHRTIATAPSLANSPYP